jgi:hypothetical protein
MKFGKNRRKKYGNFKIELKFPIKMNDGESSQYTEANHHLRAPAEDVPARKI